ncbi:hypothetical protein Scep_012220 [Stephania cephalantha]|uniref:Uncharacterized protein n=1 Tax=Stephania cephalantha TaxID=152367 RepID=A0AAP0JGW4_9MAGN
MVRICLSCSVRQTLYPSARFFKYPQKPPPTKSFSISSSSSSSSSFSTTPLFLRPPIHSASFPDLKKWQDWAKHLALSVGPKFVETDNGPDADLLCRELKWLLQDAVVDDENDAGFVKLRADLEEMYALWTQRIEERRPFQYLVGCEHWRDLVLCVQEGVLIPRPETEHIVDMVEEVICEDERMREGLWVDLGTGSGALAVGIGRMLGDGGRLIATDLSPLAGSVTAFNVRRYGLQDKVDVRLGSWFEPLQDVNGKPVGLVSNPPYIPGDHIFGLQAEVARHEPRIALDGGENGMDALLHLCEGAATLLKPGGFFALETNGEKQPEFLVDFMTSKMKGRFRDVRVVSDFAGVQRFVSGFCC